MQAEVKNLGSTQHKGALAFLRYRSECTEEILIMLYIIVQKGINLVHQKDQALRADLSLYGANHAVKSEWISCCLG